MLNTRERQEDQVRYDSSYASRPYNTDFQNVGQAYPQDNRVTNNNYYTNTYEANTYDYSQEYSNNYQNYDDYLDNQSPVFKPFEYDDIVKENSKFEAKEKRREKLASKTKLSVKAKVLVGVYFALITLIVTMLLVNTIPSVGAQAVQENSTPEIVVNEDAYNSSLNDAVANGSVVTNAPYEYNTSTNWFDKVCDYFNGLFS